MDLAEEIVSKALELGYLKCGIVKVGQMKGYAKKLDQRIELFPEVEQIYRRFYSFSNPGKEYPWVKSIVVCARWYGRYRLPEGLKGKVAKYYQVDSRRDTNSQEHRDSTAFEGYLQEQGLRTATYRDFGITALRWAAMKAGIGVVRKNNFFYTERGSWVFLEAYLIDVELEHISHSSAKACPPSCSLCMMNCPTGSLSAPYIMNHLSCVSCLTTFQGEDWTTDKFQSQTGDWIFGCEACQDVCPFNHKAWVEEETYPGLDELGESISLEKLIEMDYECLKDTIQPKFWYIPKEKVWKWKTNALNAMLNNYQPRYLPYIEKARSDQDEHVRRMAQWVIIRLSKLGVRVHAL
jgi:epoxyqueuosine reductase